MEKGMKKEYKIKRENLESYIVFSNENETKHIATFKDVMGKRKFTRVESNIKIAFRKAKNEDKSQQNKYDKYIEHSVLNENTLNKRAKYKSPQVSCKAKRRGRNKKITKKIGKFFNSLATNKG